MENKLDSMTLSVVFALAKVMKVKPKQLVDELMKELESQEFIAQFTAEFARGTAEMVANGINKIADDKKKKK